MTRRASSRFWLGTLRGRIVLGVALVHAVLMSLFIADLTTRERALLLGRQIDVATTQCRTLATSAAEWIAADDVSGLQELVEAQRSQPEMLFVLLTDADGQVLAATDRSRLGQYVLDMPREPRLSVLAKGSGLVDVAAPATVGGTFVGWARVGIGQTVASRKLSETTWKGVAYALGAVLAGGAAAWLVGGQATRRLHAVQRTIAAVRAGDHRARSALSGSDEAAELAREFDTMLDAVAERDAELRSSEERYRSLIDRVQVAIVVHDGKGQVVHSNPMAHDLLGLSGDELSGKALIDPEWHFVRRNGSVLPVEEYPVSVVLDTKRPLRGLVVGILRPNRREVAWVLVSGEPERGPDGDITRVVVSFVDITDREVAEAALRRVNRELRAISNCNQVLVRAQDEQVLLDEVCRIICADAGYRMAFVGYAENDEGKTIRPVAWAGVEDGYLREARLTWADTERGRGPAGITVRTGRSTGVRDFAVDPEASPWREAALSRGYRSSLCLALKGESSVPFGALTIYSTEPDAFDAGEVRLMEELAGDLSYGILALRERLERRRVEEALQSSEAKYRTLWEESFDGLFVTSANGRILDINKKGMAILGYASKEEVQRLSFVRDVYADPADRDRVLAIIRASDTAEYDVVVKRKLGDLITIRCALSAVRDERGVVASYRGILRDVTEQIRAEETLRKLSRAVDQSPVSIVITNREAEIEYVNPRFTLTTGYEAGEVLGKNPRILSSGETPADQYRAMWEVILSGRDWHGELHNRRKDGVLYWERVAISPIFDAAGGITHFVGIQEDTSQQRKLQEELRQAQKMEAFGQLAGGVAHDFNNILTVIQGNACLLQEGAAEAERSAAIAEVLSAVERAARLTRQLLLFSRRQVVQLKDIDLNTVVTEMTRMLQRLIGEHIALEAHYVPGAAMVHADRGMVEQILMNLSVNARDAMPEGGRLVIATSARACSAADAARHPGVGPGEYVCVSVRDSGCGIPPEHLPHIFEPFYTTKDVGRGTGLGLATVFGIVEQHHGWIDVETAPGTGTAFHVYLPRAAVKRGEGAERPSIAGERRGTETILVAEDEAPLRSLLRSALERQGYRVLAAGSGAEALELFRQHREEIALLFTDMVMPGGMTGRELARQIQAERPGLPVLFTTGYTDEMLGDAATLRGSTSLLEKPYDVVGVLRAVRRCLDCA